MKIIILGSGTSTGVPEIGCTCFTCTSVNPKDKRLRCSGLVEVDGVRILIDCGPDFREQMMRLNDFKAIDAVLVTHEHYDHVGGLDDLRPFCRFRDVPVYAEPYAAQHLRERIPYCFAEKLYPGVPHISLEEIFPGVPFLVSNSEGKKVEILPIRVMHGKLPILGFRIGRMAWITDMLTMPEGEYEGGIQNFAGHKCGHLVGTHQSIGEALENVERLAPKETYFVHMSHHVGLHEEAEKELPSHVHFAYDGLEIIL